MSDPFAVRLAKLAPAVDLAASRELFESMRTDEEPGQRGPSSRRWMLAAACVLLLVAGAVGVWAVAGRDGDRAPAGPPADGTTEPTTVSVPSRGDGTEFRLIAMEPVGDGLADRGITTAATRDELQQMLAGYRDSFDRYAADIAFEASAEVAVVVERFDNACPIEFDRFTPVGSTWRIEWADKSSEPCEDIGLGWVYLVAVRRDALAGIDTFVLPAEQLGSTELPELTAPVPDAVDPTPDATSPTTLPAGPAPIGAVVVEGPVDPTIVPGVRAATSAAELDVLVVRTGLDEAPSAVDFTVDVVLGVTIVDDGCPASFGGFVVDEGNTDEAASLTLALDEATDDDCGEIGVVRSFVAIVPRASLPSRFIAVIPSAYAPEGDANTTIDLTIAGRTEVDPAYSIGEAEWGCSPTDAPVVYVTVFSPGGSAVSVELFDAGRSVDRRTSRTDADWTTMTLVPDYRGTPSPDGEIVVTESSTGQVVLRQPFDHTDRPDGFGCG